MGLDTFFIFAILFIFYALGLLIMWAGIINIRDGLTAHKWPTIQACLESCTTHVWRKHQHPDSYYALVKYSYSVDGISYVGDDVSPGYNYTSDREAHQALLERITGMQPFAIRYHPKHPHRSTIFVAERSAMFGAFFLGLFILSCGVGFTAAGVAGGRIQLPFWN